MSVMDNIDTGFKENQGLDQYIDMFENIYEPIQNVEREFNQILARMVESIAACSQYVNKADEKGLADNLPKVFSWYCSLVTKSRIGSLNNALWKKYPRCCPYCLSAPCRCISNKKNILDNRIELEQRVKEISNKPTTLDEWQTIFAEIYPRDPQGYDQKSNFAHLVEELGEASEAYRIKYFFPTALESELADVLSWIIGMANLLDSRARDGSLHSYIRYRLAEQVYKRYNGKCPNCQKIPCNCVPKEGKQKISELNALYPDDIYKLIVEVKQNLQIDMNNQLQNIFFEPEAQAFLFELKSLSMGIHLNNEMVKDLVKQLIEEPKHKRWYEKLTAAGLAENVIVSILFLYVEKLLN